MGKKKNKKNGRKKGGLGALIGGFFRFSLKVFPVLGAIALAGGIFLGVREVLYADSYLGVQKVSVEPVGSLTLQQRQSLETALVGHNILQVDLKKISRDILRDYRIKDARVYKHLPSEVSIVVTSRKPLAAIRFAGRGSLCVVSEDGMILDKAAPSDVQRLVIESSGEPAQEPVPGLRVHNHGFAEAVRFIRNFREHPLARYEHLNRILLDRLGNVTIVFGQGPEIRLGRKPAERLSGLEKIVPLLKGEGRANIEYVDLQYENVIVKQKRGK